MASYDLSVRGGGIFGLAIAWEAARRGARVRLIEGTRIGAGSSGGLVGALAPHVPESWNEKKQFQLESLLMAEGFFGSANEAGGLPTGYARLGRLQPLADQAAVTLAHARSISAQGLWHGQAAWQVIAADQPWHPVSPTGLLVHDTLSARLHPRQTALALAAAIRARSGDIIIGEAEDFGPTIHATGLQGLVELSASLGRVMGSGVKGQAILLDHDARNQPQLFIDGVHIVPHADGTTAIGSTSEHVWTDPTGTDAALEDLLAKARSALPALSGAAVLDRWAGVRPRAK
ncbi:MAG: FAD-dependent oxidoreductase, partial [Pseudorhodobacter sp.]|nr:FAD-dependent oxidoreductase [Pseudorhodobacter sp.]